MTKIHYNLVMEDRMTTHEIQTSYIEGSYSGVIPEKEIEDPVKVTINYKDRTAILYYDAYGEIIGKKVVLKGFFKRLWNFLRIW